MLILTAVIITPTIGAKNVVVAEGTSTSYSQLLSNLPGDITEPVISLNDDIAAIDDDPETPEISDLIEEAFGDLLGDMDQLFHPEDYTQTDSFDSIKEAAMLDIKSNVADIKRTSTANACRNAFDNIDDIKDRSDLPAEWQSIYDDVMNHVNSKQSLKNLLIDASDALGLDDYAKLVLWFIWVLTFAGFVAVPNSMIVIGLVESAAVALVTALVLADGIGNVVAMEKLFPLGKLTPAQRAAVATLVVSVIAFGAYIMLGSVAHSVALMLGGIIGINIFVDKLFEKFDIINHPTPINTGPVMALMRALIQWYMVEININAFPILRYLFGSDYSN